MQKYAVIIVFEHEKVSLPELDKIIGTKLLIDKELPDNIIDYKVLATEEEGD